MTKQGHVKIQAKDKWNQRYLAFDLSHGTNGALAMYHKEVPSVESHLTLFRIRES